MKAKLVCVWLALLGVFAAVVSWVIGKEARERAAREESKRKADELKAKVVEVKAEQAARKEATDAAVGKVDEAVQVDLARNPVELANALIAGTKDGKG